MHPDPLEEPAPLPAEDDAEEPVRPLLGDIEALIDDARTFLDAELNFQKSRAGFVAGRVKLMIGLGIGALFFVFMALFGLTVGSIIALAPMLSAWGAVTAVVGLLLAGVAVMLLKLRSVWAGMMREINEDMHD